MYLSTPPPTAINCGNGIFTVDADSAPLATILVRLSAKSLDEEVAKVVMAKLTQDRDTLEAVSQMKDVATGFTIGQPKDLGRNKWDVPFTAYVMDRELFR